MVKNVFGSSDSAVLNGTAINTGVFVLKEEGGSRHLRGDGNLGPGLLLDLLQVAALLPDQPAHEAVVSEDFQRDVFSPTSAHRDRWEISSTERYWRRVRNVLWWGWTGMWTAARLKCCCKHKAYYEDTSLSFSDVHAAYIYSWRCATLSSLPDTYSLSIFGTWVPPPHSLGLSVMFPTHASYLGGLSTHINICRCNSLGRETERGASCWGHIPPVRSMTMVWPLVFNAGPLMPWF